MLLAHSRQQDLEREAKQGWPEGALESLRETISTIRKVVDRFQFEPSDVLWEVMPGRTHQAPDELQMMEWDVFISHASEDKEDLVRPLAERLRSKGLRVWFDEMTLTVGDSLRRSIDRGLAHSRYGIVVISPHFLEREWPQRELDGLVARETNGVKSILPIWHNISADEIRRKSPTLADRVATTSDKGLDKNIEDFLRAMSRD